MTNTTKTTHVTPLGGNVFIDLGFEPAEALVLKAEADAIIAKKLKGGEIEKGATEGSNCLDE